ncbi:MAG: BatD family protein [Gemmatimonadales bacterium]
MVIPLLVTAAALMQQQPRVIVRIDRDAVYVGEEITYTVTIASRGNDPIEIVNPPFDGFDVLESRDRSSVTIQDGEAVRETVRVLRLLAVLPGDMEIAPVEVRQGEHTATSSALRIAVRASRLLASGLPARIRSLVERMPAPQVSEDEVALVAFASHDSATVGQQVDLVVAAWFPRDIRVRLRNPPTLRSPQVAGAWVYHRAVPRSISLTRAVGDVQYDIYVLHDVLFPLIAGRLEIGEASVSYALPISLSFLSREILHEVQSAPTEVTVRSLPSAGRPSGFAGATGADLTLETDLPKGELQLGEAATATVVLRGQGNVSLWPAPEIRWPDGLRVYPEPTEISVRSEEGVVVGSKIFRYLVVAESSGRHEVPAPAYAYFDTDRGTYVSLGADAVALVTPGFASAPGSPGAAGATPRRAQFAPPLRLDRSRPWTERWSRFVETRLLFVLLGAGPLLAVLIRASVFAFRRLERRADQRAAAVSEEGLDPRAQEFRRRLQELVPDAGLREGDGLAAALRAAGIETAVAEHAARVRDRVRRARFGPEGATDADELQAEVQVMIKALEDQPATAVAARARAGLAVMLLLAAAAPADAQAPEYLYQAGAYRAAADSFARRAEREPEVVDHWYNLGNALDLLEKPTEARAAWLRAARLAPRVEQIREALSRARAPDPDTARLTRISRVTPEEVLLVSLGLWLVGWIAVGASRRFRSAIAVLVLSLALGSYGWWLRHVLERPLALAKGRSVVLREAPYRSAPGVIGLNEGAALEIRDARGGWLLVRRGQEMGWVLAEEVVRI